MKGFYSLSETKDIVIRVRFREIRTEATDIPFCIINLKPIVASTARMLVACMQTHAFFVLSLFGLLATPIDSVSVLSSFSMVSFN